MSQAKRGHLPYGYKIENGSAVICDTRISKTDASESPLPGG